MSLRALDLFCGAGGATKGLQRAGFHVTGIDHVEQPRYCGDHFVQADALRPPGFLSDYHLIWASPPCQFHTPMSNRWRGKAGLADRRVNLIPDTRAMLENDYAGFWVIENVPGSEEFLQPTFRLCGEDFGLQVHRPRLFRSNFHVMLPPPQRRQADPVAVYGKADGRRLWTRSDGSELRAWTKESGAEAMGIDWMDEDGLREAIPPAYSEHIGYYARLAIEAARAVGETPE